MKVKTNRCKKVLVLILSVIIAISFIVPDLIVIAEQDVYSATKLDMPSIAASDPSFSMKYEEAKLTENVNAMTLSYAWSGVSNKNNTTQYIYTATENSNSTNKVYSFKKDNAIMFYAKFPADVQKQELFFQMVASNRGDVKKYGKEQWIQIGNNKKVYYLLNGDTEWQEKNTPVSSVGGNLGNLEFTAGFEGWVRIPYDSFNIDESLSKEVFRFEFRPKQLGGDYTPSDLKNGSVNFGSFLIVSNGKEDYTKVSIDNGTAVNMATNLYCHRTNTLVPSGLNNLENTKNLTLISDGYSHIAKNKTFGYTFNNNKIIASKDGSLIFYVNAPIDKTDNLKLKINDTLISNGTKCFIINRGDKEWQETEVSDNMISLPMGFEGYVQIPVSGVSKLSGSPVSKVFFESQNTNTKVGSVLLSNIFDNVVILRTKENNATYNMTSKPYYKANLIETDKTSDSIEKNNYYTCSGKLESNSYSMGIDNGYYYKFSTGSADFGNYNVESSEGEGHFIGHIAENFSFSSGKSVRPYESTAVLFDGMNDTSVPFKTKSFTLSAGTEASSKTNDSLYFNSGVFKIDGVANKPAEDKYYAHYNFKNIKWSKNGAVMFYVNHLKTGSEAEDTRLYLVNGTTWVCLTNNTPYYRLKSGDNAWEKCTTVLNSGNAGDLVIPAGFEGWIKVPTSSFKTLGGTGTEADDHDLTSFQFFPVALGGKYGSLQISAFMTVDEGNKNYFSLTADSLEESVDLLNSSSTADIAENSTVSVNSTAGYYVGHTAENFSYSSGKSVRPYASTAILFDGMNDTSVPFNTKSFTLTAGTKPASGTKDSNYLKLGKFKIDGVSGKPADEKYYAHYNFDAIKWSKDGAVMFYVNHHKIGSTAKETKLYLINATKWTCLSNNAAYYRLKKGSSSWEECTTTLNSGSAGDIVIPAEFEGYIRIPTSAFKTYDGTGTVADDHDLTAFQFFPWALGKEYGSLEIGAFMTIDDGNKKYSSLKLDSSDKQIKLYETSSVSKSVVCTGVNDVDVPFKSKSITLSPEKESVACEYSLDDQCYVDYKFDNIKWSKSGAVMFYVNHRNLKQDGKEVKLHLINGTKSVSLANNTPYYRLEKGDISWENCVTSGNVANAGDISLPAGFEGYIRIPTSAFRTNNGSGTVADGHDLSSFKFYPSALGGAYGSIDISAFMTLNVCNSCSSIKIDSKEIELYPLDYVAYLAQNFTFDSGKATSPVNSSALSFSGMNSTTVPFDSKSFTLSVGTAASGTTDSTYLKDGKFVISGGATNPADDGRYCVKYNFDKIKWSENGAVMFYVNHIKTGSDSKATTLYLENGTKSVCLANNAKYERLKDGNDFWEECTTTENDGTAGDITIPAGFKGFIRIPTSSFKTEKGAGKTAEKHDLTSFSFFPSALGKEYGSLQIGAFMTVGGGSENYSSLRLGATEESIKIAKTYNIHLEDFSGQKMFSTTADIKDFNTAVSFKKNYTMSSGNAFMIYVRQTGRADSRFMISFGEGGNVFPGYNAEYYLTDSSNTGRKIQRTQGTGVISVPAGFSGWITVSYDKLCDTNNKNLSGSYSFNQIRILPLELGGPYGELSIGSFLISNHPDDDLPTIRVDGKEEVPITGCDYYSAFMPELSEVLACGNVARTVAVSTENCDFLNGGSLYTVAPKNGNTKITLGAQDGAEVAFREELSVEDKNGLLIYVSLPDSSNSFKFGNPFTLAAEKPVYVLGNGNEEKWKEQKTGTDGSVSLPAGFKGYIRFPFTSMKTMPSGDIKKFVVSFTAVGGSYGNPVFGNVMFIKEVQCDLYDVLVSGTTSTQTLIGAAYLEGFLVKGSFSAVNNSADDNHILSVEEIGNTFTPDVKDGYAGEISAPKEKVNITTETLPCIHFTPDKYYTSKIKTSGGVMFYVKNDSDKENSFFFQAYGDVYATTLRASEYSVLQKDDSYWTKHVSNGNGDITLPANFEGYIRIPYLSLKSANGALLNEPIKYFNFIFKNVGGEYKKTYVGDLIILDNYGDFGKLALEGNSSKIDIYGPNKKTVYNRNDVAIWNSVTDPICGYETGSEVPFTPALDSEDKEQNESVFTESVTDNATPFDAKSVAFDSSERLLSKNDTPRFSGVMPFKMNGAKGIVVAVDLPAAKSGTNDLFFQISTASGKWLTVKYEFLIPVIRFGETDWSYVEVKNQRVQLLNNTESVDGKDVTTGFKGYIFFPNECLSTYKDSAGAFTTLNGDDTVVNVAFGFGEYGGNAGKAYINGMFTSMNGVLSHNGAFVDGSTECRNIFSGESVSADSVKRTVFDVPSKSGAMLLDLPVPTGEEVSAYIENVTSHSADVIIDKFKGADRYRCDLYIMRSLPGQFGYTYYEYVESEWSDSTEVKLDGLTTGIYYTLVVCAFKGDEGLYIYPLCSIFPESQVIGDMLVAQDDPYLYEWNTDEKSEDGEYDYEYEEITDDYPLSDDIQNTQFENDGEEYEEYEEYTEEYIENDNVGKNKKRKKIIRRRRKSGLPDWAWIVIIAGGICLLAGGTIVLILFKKKRRK